MKTAIVYLSRYGVSKQYAIWIGETCDASIFSIHTLRVDTLQDYARIIFVGGLRYHQVPLLTTLKKYKTQLKNKEIIVCISAIHADIDALQESIFAFFKREIALYIVPGYLSLPCVLWRDTFPLNVTRTLNPKSPFLKGLKTMKTPSRDALHTLISSL